MRFCSFLVAGSLAFVAAPAFADGGVGGKGDVGGKGGLGPGAGGSEPGSANETEGADKTLNLGINRGDRSTGRPYEFEADWETHRMIRQEDLQNPESKVLNYLGLSARYDFDAYDRVSVSGGAYQRFLVDQGETGFRLDDVVVSYSRYFLLPDETVIRITPGVMIPTSLDAQLAGWVAAPQLRISAMHQFGHFSLSARLGGTVFINRYNAMGSTDNDPSGGGQPNTIYSVSGYIDGEYSMPFLPDLSLGAAVTTGYSKSFKTEGTPPPGAGGAANYNGQVQDQNFPTQPLQQSYGFEVYARYFLPQLWQFRTDITLAYADGNPTTGPNSVLHEGVAYYYGFFRETSQVYVAFTARY